MPVGGEMPCPLKKGAIWVQIADDGGSEGIGGVWARINGGTTSKSGEDGLAPFDPLEDSTYEVDLKPLEAPVSDAFLLPSALVRSVQVKAGQIALVRYELIRKALNITKVDPCFAPGVEALEIEYEIKGLATEDVLFEVKDAADKTIFKRPLGADEKADGKGKKLAWGKTEKADADGHELHGKFLDPLHGPYKVSLFHSQKLQAEQPFNVLYHSIRLEAVAWDALYKAASGSNDASKDPGGDTPEGRMWVQYKLNELGFWAGPIDGNDSEDLKKAVARFRHAHHELSGWSEDKPPYEYKDFGNRKDVVAGERLESFKTIDDALRRVLAAGETKQNYARPTMDPAPDPGAPALKEDVGRKILVESHRFFISSSQEFEKKDQPITKTAVEAAWLTRPHVPIRAKILLKGKAGDAVDAPEAVGGVKIRWSWTDESESDVRGASTTLAPELPRYSDAEPSRTAEYIPRVLKLTRLGKYNGCPKDCGGVVSGNDKADAVEAFAACVTKDATLSYDPKSDGVDVPAHTDAATGLAGSAVVYLRPSTIAGDNYTVAAKLEFGDAKDRLERLHYPDLLTARTGRFVVWRRVRLAAYVGWPRRTKEIGQNLDVASAWKDVAVEFNPSMLHFDVDGISEYPVGELIDTPKLHAVWDGAKKDFGDALHADLKAKSFSDKSVFGDPEASLGDPPFDDFVNKLIRFDGLKADLGVWPPADPIKEELYNLLLAAECWKTSGDGNVKGAGEKVVGKFAPCFDKLDAHRQGGDLPATMPATLACAPAFDANALTAVAQSTDQVRVAQMHEMILTTRFRTERDAYDQAPHGAWVRGAVGRVGDQADTYPKMLNDQLSKLIQGTQYNKGLEDSLRRDVFLQRGYYINRRTGTPLDNTKYRFSEVFELAVRKKLAADGKPTDGVVVLDYQCNDPVDIDGTPYVADGVAFGAQFGTVLLDHGLKSRFYSLAAHEIAHNLFLQHWVNAGSEANRVDHDQRDDNCILSYPFGGLAKDHGDGSEQKARQTKRFGTFTSIGKHYCYDVFRPHFCGKCNLVLRGWNTRAGNLPLVAGTVEPEKTVASQKLEARLIAPGVKDDAVASGAEILDSVGISFFPPHLVGAGTTQKNANHVELEPLPAGWEAFPTQAGYSDGAAKDPCAFRVEVVDEEAYLAGKAEVTASLAALMPTLDASGKITGHEEFPPREHANRCLTVKCHKVGTLPNTFRSAYLRLVTDEADKKKLPEQTLLVTDIADGEGRLEDSIEILDQKIRLRYDAKQDGKPVEYLADVGRKGWLPKKRVRLAFHVQCKPDPDERAKWEKIVRHRTMRWVRRVYAQAHIAPKIVSLDFLDPNVPLNMLGVAGYSSDTLEKLERPTGKDPSGGTSKVELEFPISFEVDLNAGTDEQGVFDKVREVLEASGLEPRFVGTKQVAILDENHQIVAPGVKHDDSQYPANAIGVNADRVVPENVATKPSGTSAAGGTSKITLSFKKAITTGLTNAMAFKDIADGIKASLEGAGLGLVVTITAQDILELRATRLEKGQPKTIVIDPQVHYDTGLNAGPLSFANGVTTAKVTSNPSGKIKEGDASSLVVKCKTTLFWQKEVKIALKPGLTSRSLLDEVAAAIKALDTNNIVTTVTAGTTYLLSVTKGGQPVKVEVSHDDATLPTTAIRLESDQIKVEPSGQGPQGGSKVTVRVPVDVDVPLQAGMESSAIADEIVKAVNAMGALGYTASASDLRSIVAKLPLARIESNDKALTTGKFSLKQQDFRTSGAPLPNTTGATRLTLTFTAPVNVELEAGLDFTAIADKIAAKVKKDEYGLGLSARTAMVPQPDPDFGTARDVYFFVDDKPLVIGKVNSTDTKFTNLSLLIARTLENDGEDRIAGGGTPGQRFLLRQAEDWSDDRIDAFVVLTTKQLKGRAYAEYIEKDPGYKPNGNKNDTGKLRRAVWVGIRSDHSEPVFGENVEISPFTLSHEIGHVLADTAHNNFGGDVMKGSWSAVNSEKAEKRIYSAPILVDSYGMGTTKAQIVANKTPWRSDTAPQDMAQDMHNRGGKALLEDW